MVPKQNVNGNISNYGRIAKRHSYVSNHIKYLQSISDIPILHTCVRMIYSVSYIMSDYSAVGWVDTMHYSLSPFLSGPLSPSLSPPLSLSLSLSLSLA